MKNEKEIRRLSQSAVTEYKAKLDDLKTVKRLEIAQQIREARAFGDISENAEYDAAMDMQARIEYEISQLEELLANVEIIDDGSIDLTSVSVGGRVKVKQDNLEPEEFDIVSTTEIEPFVRKVVIECNDSDINARLGHKPGEKVEVTMPVRLSNESAVGKALIGHKAGDMVEAITGNGIIRYQILDITKIPEIPKGKTLSQELL